MKNVHSLQDPLLAKHLQRELEEAGIACEIRTEIGALGGGDLPISDVWLQIWVEAAIDAGPAVMTIERLCIEGRLPTTPGWDCPSCTVSMEFQFVACWNCEEGRPESG